MITQRFFRRIILSRPIYGWVDNLPLGRDRSHDDYESLKSDFVYYP